MYEINNMSGRVRMECTLVLIARGTGSSPVPAIKEVHKCGYQKN